MDDYTLQQELEALAGNAYNPPISDESASPPEPMRDTIARWQKLFDLSADEAVDRIGQHRENLTRTRVSDEHWSMMCAEKEGKGYDREAYEYELEMQKKTATLPGLLGDGGGGSSDDPNIAYLVELTGPLGTVEEVQRAAQLELPPTVVQGRSIEERRPVRLCCIDARAKVAIVQWAGREGKGFEPTILVDPRSLQSGTECSIGWRERD